MTADCWNSGAKGHMASTVSKTWRTHLNALDEGDEVTVEE